MISEALIQNIYKFAAALPDKTEVGLDTYKDKVILIVNTASKCGFTPQYKGLEYLYEKYKDKGLVILGFPCDQFGNQEFSNDQQIQNFCKEHYEVTFPVFSRIYLNGNNAHPIFKYLKNELPGILGSKSIKWNFTKFLVDRNGNPVKRFAPIIKPEEIEKDIIALL